MLSDWTGRNYLYFVSAATLIRLFRAVGMDDVVLVQYRRGSEGVTRVAKASREDS